MADEYTPTTDVVRDAVTFPRRRLGEPRDMTEAAFDRWLAEHDRESAEKAWDEGYDYATNGKWGPGENPHREGDPT